MNGTPGNCKAVDGAPKPTGEMGKEVGLLDLAPASFFGGFKQGAVAEQAYGDPRSLAAAQRGGGGYTEQHAWTAWRMVWNSQP